MIKLIIFDWAGTTIDYGSMAPIGAFQRAFKTYGLDLSSEEIRKPMGVLKIEHIKILLETENVKKQFEEKYKRPYNMDDVNQINTLFESYLMENLSTYTNPLPHVVEAINELKELGIKIGSTTGYTSDMMAVVVPEAKAKGYSPDYFCTAQIAGRGRPFPDMVYKNMAVLEVKDKEAVIKVGDTVADIKEGKEAGIKTIGVVIGSNVLGLEPGKTPTESQIEAARETFLEAGADYVIESMKDLVPLIHTMDA